MAKSGLIDFQAALEDAPEPDAAPARARATSAIGSDSIPRSAGRADLIQRNLQSKVTYYAYPFGDANQTVLERLSRADFVSDSPSIPGGNAFFANPLMLRRTMVFGDHDLNAFKAALQVFREADLR